MSTDMVPWIEVTAGDVRWNISPQWRAQLLGPDGLRLEEWLRGGQAQVVKHGPHRTVYRVALPGINFFLKHYRLMDMRAWLRELVRPAKARMEFERALAVAARQVPTITPLGLGERRDRRGPGDSFLVTHSLEDVEPLTTFIATILPTLDAPRQARVRLLLAQELGRFIARMHDSGIVHYDLHTGNLLVGLEADDRLRLFLIDLHAVKLGRPLTWPASRANLILLNRWSVLHASRSERLRFWNAYWATRRDVLTASIGLSGVGTAPQGRVVSSQMVRDLEERTWASNLRFWQHRDRRCLENNRYYQRIRSPAVVGHAIRDLDPATLAELTAEPDAPFHRPDVTVLKDSPSSTVIAFELLMNGAPRRVIYKRFRVTSWKDPWMALARQSPALRSWIWGQGLRERCLPTARPLALLHRRRGGLAYEGYLLTEMIEDAVDLHGYLAYVNVHSPAVRRSALRCRIDKVARLVGELHRRNLSHRDLKAANILVARDEVSKTSSGTGIWLIDLVGVAFHRSLPHHRRLQNLARLHASFHQSPSLTRTDKLRFLRVYLQWGLFGSGGWKRWWRQVGQATRSKVSRNLRNGRPLA